MKQREWHCIASLCWCAVTNLLTHWLRKGLMICVRHWLSSDTKEERLVWTNSLNEALVNLRSWHADALRPVKRHQQPVASAAHWAILWCTLPQPFDAHCCHMGTAIKHPVPDHRVAIICNFWHPGTLSLRAERQSAGMSKLTNDCLTRTSTQCFIAVPIWQQWASKG